MGTRFAACIAVIIFVIAAAVVFLDHRAVPTADPAVAALQQTVVAQNATIEAENGRTANAAEAAATNVPNAIKAASSNNGGNYNSGVSDSVCQSLAGNAQGFGESVNPAWVTFLAPNGCMISTNTGVDFHVPAGWRADFTDLNGDFHSCGSSTGNGGLYGPADGSAENAISMWQTGSESHCLKWTTWGETHPDAYKGNAASNTNSNNGNSSAQVNPTVAPAKGGNLGGNNTTSGDIQTMAQLLGFTPGMSKTQMVDAWKSYVGQFATIHDESEDPSFAMTPDGGIVVSVADGTTLPPYLEANGGSGPRTIKEKDKNRTMDNGAFWRIYPPKELRKAMGLTGGSTAA